MLQPASSISALLEISHSSQNDFQQPPESGRDFATFTSGFVPYCTCRWRVWWCCGAKMLFPLWEKRVVSFPTCLKATCIMLCFFVFSVFISHNVFLSVELLMLLKKRSLLWKLRQFIATKVYYLCQPRSTPAGNQVFWRWHNRVFPCWCCTWRIIINVDRGTSLKLTNHFFVMSWLRDSGKKTGKICTWGKLPFQMLQMLNVVKGKGLFLSKPPLPKHNQVFCCINWPNSNTILQTLKTVSVPEVTIVSEKDVYIILDHYYVQKNGKKHKLITNKQHAKC